MLRGARRRAGGWRPAACPACGALWRGAPWPAAAELRRRRGLRGGSGGLPREGARAAEGSGAALPEERSRPPEGRDGSGKGPLFEGAALF